MPGVAGDVLHGEAVHRVTEHSKTVTSKRPFVCS